MYTHQLLYSKNLRTLKPLFVRIYSQLLQEDFISRTNSSTKKLYLFIFINADQGEERFYSKRCLCEFLEMDEKEFQNATADLNGLGLTNNSSNDSFKNEVQDTP